MWAEQVSDLSIQQRVFPRISGMAERLWSPASTTNASDAARRLGADMMAAVLVLVLVIIFVLVLLVCCSLFVVVFSIVSFF